MSIYVRMYVKITTEQGEFIRLGKSYSIPIAMIEVDKGYLTYPDQRVSAFRIYATHSATPNDDSAVWKYIEFKGVPSKRTNISYAPTNGTVIDYNNFPTGQTETTLQLNGYVERSDRDKNRILVSTANKVRRLLGRNAHYIGNGADDGVLTFAANAIAISAGQFGVYPLYVLCERSIWVMEIGADDIAFRSIKPVSVLHGLLSKNGVASVDGTIFYLATDGLRTLPAQEMPISFTIQGSDLRNDFMANVTVESALGYFYDKASGRKEVWIGTDNGIYVFSILMQRWFMLDGLRKKFIRVKEKLIGLMNGNFVEENSSVLRDGSFRTAPITLGEPDILKKFRSVILRGFNGPNVLVTNTTLYEFIAEKQSIRSLIYSIDIDAELRGAHRTRIRRTMNDSSIV